MDSGPATKESVRPATLWRRFLAFGLDVVIMGVVGWLITLVAFDWVVGLGAAGKLIGFALTLAYFGIGDSGLTKGSTLGKVTLGLAVVGRAGRHLSVPAAAFRSLVLITPFYLNGLAVGDVPKAIDSFFCLMLFGLLGCLLYLFVFNRGTYQSLHDLVVGSIVVRGGQPMPAVPPLWRGHWLVIGALCLASLLLPWLGSSTNGLAPSQSDLWDLRQATLAMVDARNVIVSRGSTRLATVKEGTVTKEFLRVTVHLKSPVKDGDEMERVARRVAEMVMHDYRSSVGSRVLIVAVMSSVDLGIFASTSKFHLQTSVEAWPETVPGFFPG